MLAIIEAPALGVEGGHVVRIAVDSISLLSSCTLCKQHACMGRLLRAWEGWAGAQQCGRTDCRQVQPAGGAAGSPTLCPAHAGASHARSQFCIDIATVLTMQLKDDMMGHASLDSPIPLERPLSCFNANLPPPPPRPARGPPVLSLGSQLD